MKTSIIRGALLFAAGAGCATLAGGIYSSAPITPEQFQERANTLLTQLADLGGYVAIAKDGRVGIFTDPYSCVPTPKPKMPANAVDLIMLHYGLEAMNVMNEGYLVDEPMPVYVVDKCKPYSGK